jgi:uncharacterized protein (DUF4415 family)
MPVLKPGTIIPIPEEDVAITRGIASDPDTYELSDAEFIQLKRMPGRPLVEKPKVYTGIRLDADVLATFKATGKGWQTRINAALREWIVAHPHKV